MNYLFTNSRHIFVLFCFFSTKRIVIAPNINHRKGATVTETDGKSRTAANEQVSITEMELKEHNGTNGSSSWIAMEGKVYNVSNLQ